MRRRSGADLWGSVERLGLAALVVAGLAAWVAAGAAVGASAMSDVPADVVLVSSTSLDSVEGSTGFVMSASNLDGRSTTVSLAAPAPASHIAPSAGLWDGRRWLVVLGPFDQATLRGTTP